MSMNETCSDCGSPFSWTPDSENEVCIDCYEENMSKTTIIVPQVFVLEEFDYYGGKLQNRKGYNALWVLAGEAEKPTIWYSKDKIQVTVQTQWENEDGSRKETEKSRVDFGFSDPRIDIGWKQEEVETDE